MDIFGPPTYLPRLVNVVCERPLILKLFVNAYKIYEWPLRQAALSIPVPPAYGTKAKLKILETTTTSTTTTTTTPKPITSMFYKKIFQNNQYVL